MVKVYAISLGLGLILLIGIIFATAFRTGDGAGSGWFTKDSVKLTAGVMVGFGMGGMSAEFSPLDLTWQVALLIALVAAGLSLYWVRYAVAMARPS